MTFSILEDLTHHIAKDKVQIVPIVPRLSDPHTYQLKPSDMVSIQKADLVLSHGLGFEGWLKKALISCKGQCVEVASSITHRTLPDGSIDSHTWHDIALTAQTIPMIVKALSAILPKEKEFFEENGRAYTQNLYELDKEILALFKTVPKEKRLVVTTHDAFWYFGKAYGIQFISPVGITTEQEPSASAVADLINLVKNKGIQAIFIENLSSGRVIEQIAKETGRDTKGILYADSLSKEGSPASTYIDMIRYNTRHIYDAFQNN